MSESVLPARLPLLSPDRTRDRVDETNITLADVRDKYKELERIMNMAEHDQSIAVKRTLRKVSREFAHMADLLRLRTMNYGR